MALAILLFAWGVISFKNLSIEGIAAEEASCRRLRLQRRPCRQSWNAPVVYTGSGDTLWGSGDLLDNPTYSGRPILRADGSMAAADDRQI